MHQKSIQISSKKKSSQKWFKKCIWERLGLHLGRFGGGFERDLETLGASWVVFGTFFFMIVFGTVFKIGLGGFWTGFWLDFKGVGRDFGKVWEGFWKRFCRTLGDSGLFWAIGHNKT